MNTIVVLVDERPESRAALHWALNIGALPPGSSSDAAGFTLHVVLGPSTDIPGGPRYVSPSLSDAVAARLRDAAVQYEVHFAPEDPVHCVITLAETYDADLVVIGLQTRSATLKLVIGSHARDILADAPCPVVAVKE
jgi:nucleotide-binding universal stress UspA family protein